METKSLILIDGQYRVINSPDRLVIFDVRNPRTDEKGASVPVETIPLRGPVSSREAGRLALTWLLAYEHLTQTDYLRFLDIFLAAYPLAVLPVENRGSLTNDHRQNS